MPRNKNLPVHVYLDPALAETVEYVKYTYKNGLTGFVTDRLREVKIDSKKLDAIKLLKK